MKKIITALGVGALVAVAPVSPAFAQALEIVDPQGEKVGHMVSMDTETGMITLKTDKYEIVLPKTSFTPNGETMMIAMTQAELNAEVERGKKELADTVSIGRDVRDADLVAAGTIEAMTADAAMIRLTNNTVVAVPLNGITPHLEGAILGYRVADLAPHGVELTPEQVQEQVAAAAEAAAEAEADASAGAPAAGDAAAQ
ncbi:hypothetical protein [Sphingomicrobium clamense]|uniref:Uncharacterized protein n=1 Tax=Sphingomicrobium clamense TaxID=2851013 RepID=A0ABS6V5X3_9SPHN|nr:hypothetical protein [Sphingomicrobium sp. B8]MBW0144946.1 hypothetical protein [Sphingomicrobium sp. B8]